jgi:hypothetical protein
MCVAWCVLGCIVVLLIQPPRCVQSVCVHVLCCSNQSHTNALLTLLLLHACCCSQQPYIEWADSLPQQQQAQRRTIAAPPQELLLPAFVSREQHLNVVRGTSPLTLSWRLGGCFSVDSTRLLFGRYDGDSSSSGSSGSDVSTAGTIAHDSGGIASGVDSSSSSIDGSNNATLAAQATFATPTLFGDCR